MEFLEKITFGDNLKMVRKKKGLSQRELGERLGITQQTVAQYEKLESPPKYETLKRIAEALDTSFSELRVLSTPQAMLLKNQEYFSSDIGEWIKKFWDFNCVKIIDTFDELNNSGQNKVIDYAKDIVQIPEYQKEPEE